MLNNPKPDNEHDWPYVQNYAGICPACNPEHHKAPTTMVDESHEIEPVMKAFYGPKGARQCWMHTSKEYRRAWTIRNERERRSYA